MGLDGFVLGTNGAGYKDLIVPVGGMKQSPRKTIVQTETDDFGNTRTNYDIFMSGSAISDFALEVVPPTLDKILTKARLNREDIDYYVFHQANKFMLNFLQMKCDLLNYPYWNDVAEYGNTVSCSIPIAIVDMLEANKDKNIKNILSIGFGVGLSWGGCVIDLSMYNL